MKTITQSALSFALPLSLGTGLALFAAPALSNRGVTVPHTFEADTPALASEVNENFLALADGINANEQAIFDLEAAANTIVVAKSGGQFDSVAEALDSIVGNSAANPFVVLVHPGLYDEKKTSKVGPYVSLRGLGKGSTLIRYAGESASPSVDAAVVQLLENGAVRDLTLINNGAGSAFNIGIHATGLSRKTEVTDVEVRVDGNGGLEHHGLYLTDCDIFLLDCKVNAKGATQVNTAFTSRDLGGPFAQPLIRGCLFEGIGQGTGVAADLKSTAADIRDSELYGFANAIRTADNGITILRNCRINTLGTPVMDQKGSASVISQCTFFVGLTPTGLASQFKYAHCIKPNSDVVVNGFGSTIQ